MRKSINVLNMDWIFHSDTEMKCISTHQFPHKPSYYCIYSSLYFISLIIDLDFLKSLQLLPLCSLFCVTRETDKYACCFSALRGLDQFVNPPLHKMSLKIVGRFATRAFERVDEFCQGNVLVFLRH